MTAAAPSRRRLVPETIQTSTMDCGPAALHSLLAGFGVPVSYGRLREACQTDVDGTSIGALEEVARALGLDVAQLMLPVDHVGLPSAGALPAIAVSRLPNGMPHFVVAWRRQRRWLQVMDPGTGRRFVTARTFPELLYVHEQPVPFAAWEAFSGTPAFQAALVERLRALGLGRAAAAGLIERGDALALGALDARARALAAAGPRGASAQAALAAAAADPEAERERLPPEAWFARPTSAGPEPAEVRLRGAVLVRAREGADGSPDPASLPPDLAAVLTEPPAQPGRRLLDAARAAGRVAIAPLAAATAVLAAGAVAEATLLQGSLGAIDLRSALLAVAALAATLAVVETLVAGATLGAGRRLEIGLRRALAAKLPHLPDRYLRSRPSSDMAERAHVLYQLRALPLLATQLLAATLETLFVAVALCVLNPAGAPYVAVATLGALGAALAVQLPLRERELRAREHAGALSQTTLDGLLGVLPIRAHGAQPALAAEHDERLRGWVSSARAAVRARGAATFAQTAVGVGLAVPVVVAGLQQLDGAPERLLLVLWAVTIPITAERAGQIALQWPQLRSLALRLAEPLDAPAVPPADAPRGGSAAGAEVMLRAAALRASGSDVLKPTTLRVRPGEHVALVGPSGAGKSTILSLVLGLAEASAGTVEVDGAAPRSRWPEVAWVDPQVRVWNRPLADNVSGSGRLGLLLPAAELEAVAARVGDEPLGADGGLLSGGEAQRVRLARALARDGVRLAVLDEPLRGLDRAQRRRLLGGARARWRDATVLCATHDVAEALNFDRVLVVEGGRVVADGAPAEVLERPGSRLRAMLDAEQALHRELDAGAGWRRLRVEGGRLREEESRSASAAPAPARAAAPADRLDPAAGAHPGPALAAFGGATLARYALFAASWSAIAGAVFERGGGVLTWALLLAATVPLATVAELAEGRAAVALGERLRRRALRGALGLDPSWVRREGFGRTLGRSMEVDTVARLAAGGGLGAVTAAIELGVATVALALSGPGRTALLPLAAVLAAGAVAARVAIRRRREWTVARLAETDELIESIAGHRTRLAQGHPQDDAGLERYARIGKRADRPLAALAGALPRAALAAGLAGVALGAGGASPEELALAIGGVLLAAGALRRVAPAVETLGNVAHAREALAPILAAAASAPPAARAARASSAGGPLRARGLRVEREGRAVLRGVDLELRPGDRAVLIGPSGAGKSTLAAALAGLLPAAAGTVVMDGADAAQPGWQARVGLVPQHGDNHVLLAPLAFNLLMGRCWPPRDEDLEEAAAVCRELGLGPARGAHARRPGAGGGRDRLAPLAGRAGPRLPRPRAARRPRRPAARRAAGRTRPGGRPARARRRAPSRAHARGDLPGIAQPEIRDRRSRAKQSGW